jgi:O-glycosyl hydrolase
MVNQNFRKGSKSGKNTSRGDSKKRQGGGPYQMNDAPSQISSNNHYSNVTAGGNAQDSSSRYDSQYMADNTKRILSFSKSQDNFDMIKCKPFPNF